VPTLGILLGAAGGSNGVCTCATRRRLPHRAALAPAGALTIGPPCPASVGPPIVGGMAGRPLAPDEPDEFPAAQPLAATGDDRFSLTGHCWVARN
jgi:hypothetical protein